MYTSLPRNVLYKVPLSLMLAIGCLRGTGFGEVLFAEEFDYPVGPAAGANGGFGSEDPYEGIASITARDIEQNYLPFFHYVSTGNALTTAGDGQSIYRPIEPIVTEGRLWISFWIDTHGVIPDYAGLSLMSGEDEELFIGKLPGLEALGYEVKGMSDGVRGPDSFSSGRAMLLYEISFGDEYDGMATHIRWNWRGDPGWVNFHPVPKGVFADSFDGIKLYSGNQPVTFDEIRIGTTMADVIRTPEPGSALLLAYGAAYIGGFKRKRKTLQV